MQKLTLNDYTWKEVEKNTMLCALESNRGWFLLLQSRGRKNITKCHTSLLVHAVVTELRNKQECADVFFVVCVGSMCSQ